MTYREEFEVWFHDYDCDIKLNDRDRELMFISWKAAKAQAVPQWIPVSDPPNDSRDVLCLKPSGTRVIDYYRNGRFQLSGDYVMWQELPAAPVKDSV